MKTKIKSLLTLFLIVWVIFSFYLFVNLGPKYIGKTYFTSENFEGKLDTFKSELGKYVLAPFDAEEAKEKITVSDEEINHHRNYYGTLAEQIENIKGQYQDRIDNAVGDSELQQLIIQERDQKIEDIKKNFEDDAHVEAKVRKQKEQIINRFVSDEKKYVKQLLDEYSYFAYSFKNTKTDEVFESGNIKDGAVFKMTFGNGKPYLTVDSSRVIDTTNYDHTLLNNIHYPGEVYKFEGTITIPKSMLNNLSFKEDYQNFTIAKITLYIIIATALLAIVSLLTFAKPNLRNFLANNRIKERFNNLPIDARIAIVLFAIFIANVLFSETRYLIGWNYNYHYYYYLVNYIIKLAIMIVFIFIFTGSSILGVLWIWESVNSEEKLKNEFKKSVIYRLSDGMQDVFLNRSIGLQAVAVLTIVFFAGIGFALSFVDFTFLFLYAFLCLFVGLPIFILFLSRTGYLNRILKQTEDMAEGRLTSEIKVKGKSPFAKHAANLNALREGVRKSLTEQAKSERLKTELITNVSHDLRTPLTSIITYTDLLKNPDLSEEERKQYIEVLDKKSARLKTLIEDLFEVSKMSSGNIELNRGKVDLTQLLQQALGEHKEAFENANLELRVSLPNDPLYAYVDGQKWWRVIDNLITNALKYSLEGTRVYVTLKKVHSSAELTVKNIANYELGDNVEELTERFKRADVSRHTEGSGLGLAIAQSIIDLHGGTMKIDVDGDLFKIIVTVDVE